MLDVVGDTSSAKLFLVRRESALVVVASIALSRRQKNVGYDLETVDDCEETRFPAPDRRIPDEKAIVALDPTAASVPSH